MKTSRWNVWIVLVTLPLLVAGCASSSAPKPEVTLEGARTVAPTWVRTELFFSIGDWTDTALSTEAQSRWEGFLEKEITPRFPDGLSVIEVYGQWKDGAEGAAVQRERTKMLVLLHPDTPEAAAKIDEIRTAWKAATGEKSVLKVSSRAEVGF